MTSKILVVDDKAIMRDSVGATLQRAGFSVVSAGDGEAALRVIARHRPDVAVTDLRMPAMDGLELLQKIRAINERMPVVLMTAYGTVDDAVRAMKDGAFDFIQKPFDRDQLVATMRRAADHAQLLREDSGLCAPARVCEEKSILVGGAAAMRRLAPQIQQIARSRGTVLISGESGSGKEVVARTIHAHSPRRDQVMLCVNCAALSASLLESELFGHERGAFTGAEQMRKGRFELSDGGTILLDEISEIELPLQAKLLRVLQEQQFERVGSSVTQQVDVRVIATTNHDLPQRVAEGAFRQDLFYRLNVLPIQLPPLRDRREDIRLLADRFLDQVALREGKEPKRFTPEALAVMEAYTWPGNVRELQNICERASVLSRQQSIDEEVVAAWLTPAISTQAVQPEGPSQIRPLEETERSEILLALDRFNGNRRRTAEALGIGIRTLGLKLKRWKEENLVADTV